MHSKVALLTLLAASITPALTAPLVIPDHDGTFGPVTANIATGYRRELVGSDVELTQRYVPGPATGNGGSVDGCLAGLSAVIENILASEGLLKRGRSELLNRQLAILVGTAEQDAIGDVLKKGLVNGAGAALGGSLVAQMNGTASTATPLQKRQVLSGQDIAEILCNASFTDNAAPFENNSDGSIKKRDLSDVLRNFLLALGLPRPGGLGAQVLTPLPPPPSQKRSFDTIKEELQTLLEDAEKLEGHPTSDVQKRQFGKLSGVAGEDGIGCVIQRGLVNGVGAAIGGPRSILGGLINEFTGNDNNKREPIRFGRVGTVVLGARTVPGDEINDIKGLFDENSNLEGEPEVSLNDLD